MAYPRTAYPSNGYSYGPAPYYYYATSTSAEKPAPLMFMHSQQGLPTVSSQVSSASSPSSRDIQTGNSSLAAPPNLPPRLRQTSSTENESTSQTPTAQTSGQPPATNGRRHRSILPRGMSDYYSPFPPPPLMATPPGVLYPYAPAVHQPIPIAYNIRPPDDMELLAFQQQFMGMPPPPLVWSSSQAPLSSSGHPQFASYIMGEMPPPYLFNNSPVIDSASSYLNPEAAEWVPSQTDDDSSDNNIILDDEINFPPLNGTNAAVPPAPMPTMIAKERPEDTVEPAATPIDPSATKTNMDTALITDTTDTSASASNLKTEPTSTLPSSSSSSSQDDNSTHDKTKPASVTKVASASYSNIILQTAENHKAVKNPPANSQAPRRPQATNQLPNQAISNDRIKKQQRPPVSASSFHNSDARRRQPVSTTNQALSRSSQSSEVNGLPKQSTQPSTDDWIEVKSKKTKKFDRNINDVPPEKFTPDEHVQKSASPPLSFTSTGDNVTTPFTSEDDFDDKESTEISVIIDKADSHDYSQVIIDDIHRRLDNDERLMIMMRGCPGN